MVSKRWGGQFKVEVLNNGRAYVYSKSYSEYSTDFWERSCLKYMNEEAACDVADSLYKDYQGSTVKKVIE